MKKALCFMLVLTLCFLTGCSKNSKLEPTIYNETESQTVKSGDNLLTIIEFPKIEVSGLSSDKNEAISNLIKDTFQERCLDVYTKDSMVDMKTEFRKNLIERGRNYIPQQTTINAEVVYCENNLLSILFKTVDTTQTYVSEDLFTTVDYDSFCIDLKEEKVLYLSDMLNEPLSDTYPKIENLVADEYTAQITKNRDKYYPDTLDAVEEARKLGFNFYLSINGISFYTMGNIFITDVMEPVVLKYEDHKDLFKIEF